MTGSGQAPAEMPPQIRWGIERILKGPALGIGQPALIGRLEIRSAGGGFAELDRGLEALLGPLPETAKAKDDSAPETALALRMLHGTQRLQELAGLPVFEPGRILPPPSGASHSHSLRVILPYVPHDPRATRQALAWVARAVNGSAAATDSQPLGEELAACLERLRPLAPRSSSTRSILAVAHQRHIPWLAHGSGLYQLGLGKRARWLRSASTERTPGVGVRMAANKAVARRILAGAGLPVPAQEAVASEAEAVAAAERLGYPVVIKPADREKASGVAPGLSEASAVRRAYRNGVGDSGGMLIERHLEGHDHRFGVVEGEVIQGIRRWPGGVWGDGRSTVRELVRALNADPHRGPHTDTPLEPLYWDREAEELLAEMAMEGSSVPAKGTFVRLRRTSNLSVGGTAEDILERVHPDNRRLAERAAATLRLDIAGVDLIMPDISRSWRDVGGGICEVNARPVLRPFPSLDHYGRLLDRLLARYEQPPMVVVAAAGPAWEAAWWLHRAWSAEGRQAGVATPEGVWIGGEPVLTGPTAAYRGGRVLADSSEVEAMVCVVDPASVRDEGLPFPAFDALVLPAGGGQETPGLREMAELLQLALPHSLGGLVLDIAEPLHQGWGARIRDKPVLPVATGSLDRHSAFSRAEREPVAWVEKEGEGCRVRRSEGPLAGQGIGARSPREGAALALAVAVAPRVGLDPMTLGAIASAYSGKA